MVTERRVDLLMWGIGIFVAGWVSCQVYYGLNHLWVERNQLAQTAATAICDNQYEDADCKKVNPQAIPEVAKIVKGAK